MEIKQAALKNYKAIEADVKRWKAQKNTAQKKQKELSSRLEQRKSDQQMIQGSTQTSVSTLTSTTMTEKWSTESRSASQFRGKIIGRHSTLTNKNFVRGDASAKIF